LRAALGEEVGRRGRQVGSGWQRGRESSSVCWACWNGPRGEGESRPSWAERGEKRRSDPREKKREAGLLLGQLGWFRVFLFF
jgi:hypothetical protein